MTVTSIACLSFLFQDSPLDSPIEAAMICDERPREALEPSSNCNKGAMVMRTPYGKRKVYVHSYLVGNAGDPNPEQADL